MHNQAFQIFSHKNIHCLLCFCPFSTAFRTAFYLAVLCYFFLGKSIIPVAFSTAIGGTLGVTGEDGPAFLTESAFVWKNKDKINLIRFNVCWDTICFWLSVVARRSKILLQPVGTLSSPVWKLFTEAGHTHLPDRVMNPGMVENR